MEYFGAVYHSHTFEYISLQISLRITNVYATDLYQIENLLFQNIPARFSLSEYTLQHGELKTLKPVRP